MNIGIDLRCLPPAGEAGAGVAHAARELTVALVNADLRNTWTIYMPADAEAFEFPAGKVRVIGLKSSGGSVLREALREAPCDLLFVPSGAVSPSLPVPCIPWVHDVAIYSHPEWFPQSFLKRMLTTHLFKLGVKRAPLVLAVSDATRCDLVETFGIREERIRVTHEGGDPILANLAGEGLVHAKQRAKHRVAERGITQPFVLQLGTLEPRKNIPTVLEAWREAKRWFDRPIDMVVAGKDGWKLAPINKALDHEAKHESEGGSRLHRVDAVDDDDRRDLLLAADLVVIPSLHEGFGLVALEAMQAGTAVLASQVGALPEVIGERGILLPPLEVAAWARALADLMNNEDDRRHLAEQGKARSQGMTWKRVAEVVLHGLTDAAN